MSTLMTPQMIDGFQCQLLVTVAKVCLNGNQYLAIEIKYNHYLERGTSCKYTTEIMIGTKTIIVKHHRFNNDRLFLPTFMRFSEVEGLSNHLMGFHVNARVVGYQQFAGGERIALGDRSYHGMEHLRGISTVNLTLHVGEFRILLNRDFIFEISGFFREILARGDPNSRHDNLTVNETRVEAFLIMIDICHHKFWCKYELKDDLLELGRIYQIPLILDFHRMFFQPDSDRRRAARADINNTVSLEKDVRDHFAHVYQNSR